MMHINLGCGHRKMMNAVNVDAFEICKPDVLHDLNKFPYPFSDNSADLITAFHVMEHLEDWWGAVGECARILKPGGRLEIRVPDPSSSTAITYRDHLHVIDARSFDGIQSGPKNTTNAWFEQSDKLPLAMDGFVRVPFKEYGWMTRFPWLMQFCADHLRNFIHEQRFYLIKVGINETR